MATQKEVAELAGVSFITVSRVINNKGNVKAETRDRVLKAIDQLNYYPNVFARGLTADHVETVAVLAPIPVGISVEETSYYRRLLIGIEGHCMQEGFDVLLSSQRIVGESFDYLKPYYERKADGLILIGARPSNTQFGRITEDDIPCVIVGDRDPAGGAISLDSDNAWGTRRATEYLISHGHSRLAYLHVNRSTRDTADRLDSFRRVLSENGLSLPEHWLLTGDFTKASGVAAARTIVSLRDRPTALVCATDLMALGVIEGSKELGLRIPQDLSIVGFDGHEIGSYIDPPMATVVQNLEGIGRHAAELVIRRIRGERLAAEHIEFPVVFEPRGTILTLN